MGAILDRIDADLSSWISAQRVFFVATAPLAADGHVNCSPRGIDSLRVLDDRRLAWLDLTGSGVETISHLRDNGRITLMWCAFDGPPRIVRVHGHGVAHLPESAEFVALAPRFPTLPGTRAIIEIAAERISTSCGWGVPLFDYVGERTTLIDSAIKKGEDGLADYRRRKNRVSLDGLPGL
ncbi:pyridoxamine 5'-phosphate oxidase [Planctomycetota bacterium]|nr:pyridoxamine 5'-phosphate oxidase [Planctomycetota bacterium]